MKKVDLTDIFNFFLDYFSTRNPSGSEFYTICQTLQNQLSKMKKCKKKVSFLNDTTAFSIFL